MREIGFSGDEVTDEQLRALEGDAELETLVIRGGPLRNERLTVLSRLSWLCTW